MKKFISIALVLMMAVALLAGCGGGPSSGGVKNGGIKSDALKDSSDTQQRWLRLPDSASTGKECNLVINPDEYEGGSADNYNRLALNIGYLDENNQVKYKVNDAIFLVETTAANGIGGTEVFIPNFDQAAEDVNTRYSEKKLTVEIDGTKISAIIPEGDESSSQAITMREKVPVDFSLDYVAVIDVQSSANIKWKLAGSTAKPSYSLLAQNDTDATGHFAYNLSETIMQQLKDTDDTSATTVTLTLTVLGAGSPLVFDNYKIVTVERGFRYAEKQASTTWYPYGIVSELTYPNGSAAKVMDYFANYKTVARQITFTADGAFYLAGKVTGKLTYDEKKNFMIVEADGYNYVISPKKKQYVTFFNSEADFLARQNGTEEPTSSTQYWSVSCGRLELDEPIYVAISLDTTATIDELCEESKSCVNAGNTASRIEENKAYWDKYLAAITIPSDMILASAPESAN